MEDATTASGRAMAARDGARAVAVQAIRKLEARVREAVKGDTLRGMVSLTEGLENGIVLTAVEADAEETGNRQMRSVLQGARLRGELDAPLKPSSRDVPVLSREGELVMASRFENVWTTRPALDEDLQAQDLDALVKVLQVVLARHTARATRTADSYERVSRLAARLAAAVGWT